MSLLIQADTPAETVAAVREFLFEQATRFLDRGSKRKDDIIRDKASADAMTVTAQLLLDVIIVPKPKELQE